MHNHWLIMVRRIGHCIHPHMMFTHTVLGIAHHAFMWVFVPAIAIIMHDAHVVDTFKFQFERTMSWLGAPPNTYVTMHRFCVRPYDHGVSSCVTHCASVPHDDCAHASHHVFQLLHARDPHMMGVRVHSRLA